MSIDSITAAKTDDEAPVSIFLESNSAFCYSCMCTIL